MNFPTLPHAKQDYSYDYCMSDYFSGSFSFAWSENLPAGERLLAAMFQSVTKELPALIP